jgi:hypothetical protein
MAEWNRSGDWLEDGLWGWRSRIDGRSGIWSAGKLWLRLHHRGHHDPPVRCCIRSIWLGAAGDHNVPRVIDISMTITPKEMKQVGHFSSSLNWQVEDVWSGLRFCVSPGNHSIYASQWYEGDLVNLEIWKTSSLSVVPLFNLFRIWEINQFHPELKFLEIAAIRWDWNRQSGMIGKSKR